MNPQPLSYVIFKEHSVALGPDFVTMEIVGAFRRATGLVLPHLTTDVESLMRQHVATPNRTLGLARVSICETLGFLWPHTWPG